MTVLLVMMAMFSKEMHLSIPKEKNSNMFGNKKKYFEVSLKQDNRYK